MEPASPKLGTSGEGSRGQEGGVTWRLRKAGPERVLTQSLNPGLAGGRRWHFVGMNSSKCPIIIFLVEARFVFLPFLLKHLQRHCLSPALDYNNGRMF